MPKYESSSYSSIFSVPDSAAAVKQNAGQSRITASIADIILRIYPRLLSEALHSIAAASALVIVSCGANKLSPRPLIIPFW